MRVLLSDGWSLAARQTATILGWSGHEVETLGGSWTSLCRHTRHVSHIHRVPPFGPDPLGWLSVAGEICKERRITVLIPTQEQAAVLSAFPGAIRETGTALAVPPFAALRRAQDKVSAACLLAEAALPQPEFTVVRGPQQLLDAAELEPIFVKAAIGTASVAVRPATTRAELSAVSDELVDAGSFDDPVLVQRRVDGPLAMTQAVYAHGELLAHHVNVRVREGAGGGASHKESARLPVIEEHLRHLGRLLRWHGALSLDCILTADGPVYIDLNPRLVEPMNAYLSGVDLVATLREVSLGRTPSSVGAGRSGTRTHQALLGLLGTASRTPTRRAVAAEALRAILHRGDYWGSHEELTPTRDDPRAVIPPAIVTAGLLVYPASWRWFAASATRAYALTPDGWRDIVARHDASVGLLVRAASNGTRTRPCAEPSS
jgi:hypothetical protein